MKNTLDLLRLTGKVIESWNGGDVPEIEKDMVLENLRRIYTEVKYAGRPETPADEIKVPAPEITPQPATVPSAPQPETLPDEPVSNQTVEVSIDLTETPLAVEADGTPVEPSCIVNSQDETAEFKENILFGEAELPVKPKLDKKAILSLYGDEPAPVKAPEQTPPVAAPVVPPPASQPVAPPAVSEEPVQVLGDVLGNGGQTVGDVYSGQGQKADVASVIGSGKVDGIRKAIGINDKFLIIRNLFDGDSTVYESVMATLDGFDDLDEALIYIHENFNWNPDNEAVKLIIDLLTRKLS